MSGYLSLTLPQLTNRLRQVRGVMPVGMTTITEPAMRKRRNPFVDRVLKITKTNAWIGANYARQVNRQRVREDRTPDFESVPRSWGKRQWRSPVVLLDTGYGRKYWYLDCRVVARIWTYRDLDTGELIDESDLLPWLIRSRPSRRQRLHKHIILRDYRLDHIAELRINGEVWRPRKCWNLLQRITMECAP